MRFGRLTEGVTENHYLDAKLLKLTGTVFSRKPGPLARASVTSLWGCRGSDLVASWRVGSPVHAVGRPQCMLLVDRVVFSTGLV